VTEETSLRRKIHGSGSIVSFRSCDRTSKDFNPEVVDQWAFTE